MARLIGIGSVIIHPTGTNPYHRIENACAMGEARIAALVQYRDTGTLPEGYSAWNDDDHKLIASPNEIDWIALYHREKTQ